VPQPATASSHRELRSPDYWQSKMPGSTQKEKWKFFIFLLHFKNSTYRIEVNHKLRLRSNPPYKQRHVNPDEGHCSCNALYIHLIIMKISFPRTMLSYSFLSSLSWIAKKRQDKLKLTCSIPITILILSFNKLAILSQVPKQDLGKHS